MSKNFRAWESSRILSYAVPNIRWITESKTRFPCFVTFRQITFFKSLDVDYLYEAPLAMEKENLAQVVCECLHLDCPKPDLSDWETMVDNLRHPVSKVRIALVGKYVQLHDAYISVVEALKHGGIYSHTTVEIKWVDAETVTPETADEIFKDVTGMPGSRRIWSPRCGRQDRSHPLRPHTQNSVPRYLSWNAACDRRICPQCDRFPRCTQSGTKSIHYTSGDPHHAGSDRYRRYRRNTSAWVLIHVFWTKLPKHMRSTRKKKFRNATDIAMKSTMITVKF